jgi:hypothetical protein
MLVPSSGRMAGSCSRVSKHLGNGKPVKRIGCRYDKPLTENARWLLEAQRAL